MLENFVEGDDRHNHKSRHNDDTHNDDHGGHGRGEKEAEGGEAVGEEEELGDAEEGVWRGQHRRTMNNSNL